MYQATRIQENLQRPAILHAYGGAKTCMEAGLGLIKEEGWITLAAAMVGAANKIPDWASNAQALRPVPGTSIEINLKPKGLTVQEEFLLLGQWHRTNYVVDKSALATWLTNVNKELGPDCPGSAHDPLRRQASPLLTDLGLDVGKADELWEEEKRVAIDLALLQFALTNQMERLRDLVASLLIGTIPEETSGCWVEADGLACTQ